MLEPSDDDESETSSREDIMAFESATDSEDDDLSRDIHRPVVTEPTPSAKSSAKLPPGVQELPSSSDDEESEEIEQQEIVSEEDSGTDQEASDSAEEEEKSAVDNEEQESDKKDKEQ